MPNPNPLCRRWVILLAFALIIFTLLLIYSGPAWPVLLTDLILEGCYLAFWLACATLTGRFLLRRFPPSSSALAFATSAALGLGLIGLLILTLGLLGWLNRVTAIAILILPAIPELVRLRHARPNFKSWLFAPVSSAWLTLIAAPFFAITLAGSMLPPGLLWKNADDPHPYDVLEYHLQIPREWYEAHRIIPLRHNVFSFFPMNAEMHSLLAMHLRGGPWEGMYLAQLMSASFMVLTLVAIYGICRALRRARGDDGRAIPILAAVLAAVIPWTTLLSPVAYVEGAMLLYATLSIGWALLSFKNSIRHMALAGVFAGLACGVKYTAVPMVLLAVPLVLLFRRPISVRPLAVYLAAGILTFSPWLVRNTFWAHGNPLFPEAMPLLGHAHFSPDQADRWQQAHSPRPDQRSLSARLHAFSDQVLVDWRYGYVLLPVAMMAVFLGWKCSEIRALLALLFLTILIWLFATHLQSRFFTLAVPICALLVGVVSWGRMWPGLAALVVLGAIPSFLAIHTQLTPFLGLFGITDFKEALPAEYRRLAEEGRDIALVGQSQAFWYQIPMTRLSYRTVFDVDAAGASDPIVPWLGAASGRNRWILIYPSELERFSRTYAHIPPPPAEMLRQPEPIVLEGRGGM